MTEPGAVSKEIAASRARLTHLLRRFHSGELTAVGVEAQFAADSLICLMEEAPLDQRETIDYLIDRYEALRSSCLV